jgi:hypothetical protein
MNDLQMIEQEKKVLRWGGMAGILGMLGFPAFGRVYDWVSVVLGVFGLVAAVLQMIDPASIIGAGSYVACLIFYFILGWKVWSLSKSPVGLLEMGD